MPNESGITKVLRLAANKSTKTVFQRLKPQQSMILHHKLDSMTTDGFSASYKNAQYYAKCGLIGIIVTDNKSYLRHVRESILTEICSRTNKNVH